LTAFHGQEKEIAFGTTATVTVCVHSLRYLSHNNTSFNIDNNRVNTFNVSANMSGFSDNQRVRGNGNGNRGRGRGRGRSNANNAEGNGNFNIGVNGSGTRSNNTGIDGGQIPNVNGTRGYNIYANSNGALYNSNGGNFYGMASHGRGGKFLLIYSLSRTTHLATDSRNDTYETSNVYAQYGSVGNFPAHQPEDYGTSAMSSEAQIAAAAARSTTAVQAILAAGKPLPSPHYI
jgi:hypothetical protein